jgi:23S rRNA (adenine2503-C2)-methyltransferase
MLGPAVTANSQLIPLDAKNGPGGSLRYFFGLNTGELAACMIGLGEPKWRGQQLADAIYRQRIVDVEGITTLPVALRQKLAKEGWRVGRPRIAQVFTSVDGTERYLVQGQTPEGLTVETVWMPEGDGGEAGDGSENEERPSGTEGPSEFGDLVYGLKAVPSALKPALPTLRAGPDGNPGSDKPAGGSGVGDKSGKSGRGWDRATICVSSQVGCAVNCQFCLTAKLGLQRNLSAGEISGQVVAVLDRQGVEVGKDRVNLVFMGMGEPFLNYESFMAAVRLLVEEVGLSPQRMTVSTSGIVPGIERFAQEPPEIRPKLAISLNAPNDAIRSEVMPINRKWPIEAVVDAVRGVRLRTRERITFEYVLLGGVTDQPQHAAEVARLVRRTGLPAKVNLIAWNPGPGIAYTMPRPEEVELFRRMLAAEGVPVYLRRPRGRDIYAACGQLKRTVEG